MIVRLPYGKTGLTVELADDLDIAVIEQKPVPGLNDPLGVLGESLQSPIGSEPLSSLVNSEDKVGIIFSDITRPTPNHIILPSILQELHHVSPTNITLFNALGTHRRNTPEELRGLLGDDLVNNYRIVQNDAFDPSTQIYLGSTSGGNEIWINRQLVECDVKILTGSIEPHFFAGFSGGGKAVMPGMAGQRSVLRNHDANRIGNPKATWGVTWGNPIWEEIREVANNLGRSFLVNVSLNRQRQITGVFAGDLDSAYAIGTKSVRDMAMISVPHSFDIVVTTNSGYPLDLNLYQSVKGMSAAAQIVREGGAIIIATECWDGVPEHGQYARLLQEATGPQDLLDKICSAGFLEQDQWQAQVQAQILRKADIYVRTDNLTKEQIEMAHLKPCPCIEETIIELLGKYGDGARVCVLPEGPLTVPFIQP